MLSLVLASLLAMLPSARLVPDLLRDDPRISFSFRGGQLLPREAESFKVKVQAIDVVRWRVRPVDPERFLPSRDGWSRSGEVAVSSRDQDIEGEEVGGFGFEEDDRPARSWPHWGKVVRPSDSLSRWSFRLNLDSLRRLHLGMLLELEVVAAPQDFLPWIDSTVCDSARITDVFLVSRLGLHGTQIGEDSFSIVAVDLETSRLEEGVVLKEVGGRRRDFRPGANGLVFVGRSPGDRRWVGVDAVGNVAVLVPSESSAWNQKLEVGLQSREPEASRTWRKGVRIHPYLLRGVHAPGDTVVAGLLVRGMGGSIPERTVVKTRLCHGESCADSTSLVAGRRGHAQWRVALPGKAQTGEWRIESESEGSSERAVFRVEDFQPPRLQLDAKILPEFQATGMCRLEISARWLSGRPVSRKRYDLDLVRRRGEDDAVSWTLGGDLNGGGQASLPLVCDSAKQTRWSLRMSVEEAAGRKTHRSFPSLRVAIQDSAVAATRVDDPASTGGTQADSLERWGGYRFPQEVSPTRIRAGEVSRTRWEAATEGLALLQVVQGDRILRQRVMNVTRGVQTWSEMSDSTWTPQVHLVVSLLGSGGDSARWVRSDGRTLDVDAPDTTLALAMETDSVFVARTSGRVILRNGSRRMASVVVSAVDEGILSIDEFEPRVPSSWFTRPESLAISWWDALGRRDRPHGRWIRQDCETTKGLLGSSSRSGRMALGAGGMGIGLSSRARIGTGGLTARRFAWTSRVLDLPPGDTTVTFPLGDYTGALRIFAMAVSGMETRLLETSVPVRSPIELKLTAPLAVAPGDTFEVAATVLAQRGREVVLDIEQEGISRCCPGQGVPDRRDSSGTLERRLRLVALDSTGDASIVASASSRADSAFDGEVVRVTDDRSLVSLAVSGRGGVDDLLTLTLGASFLPGSPPARLEVAAGPVVGLDRIWQELVVYPHGCLEQTLSKAMPQLYLGRLYPRMEGDVRDSAFMHVHAAIEKMATFQKPDGLMSLWPNEETLHPWGSVWALQFLQEVESHRNVRDPILMKLRKGLRSVRLADPFVEAYRLALLEDALPGDSAVVGRTLDSLLALDAGGTMPWILARAARRQEHPSSRWHDSARARLKLLVGDRRQGMESSVSDRAMALHAAAILGDAKSVDQLLPQVARDLSSPQWMSTRDMGTQLGALAAAGWTRSGDTTPRCEVSWNGRSWSSVELGEGGVVLEVPEGTDTVRLRVEGSARTVGAMLHRTGRVSNRLARKSSGLSLNVLHMPDSVLNEGYEDSVVFLVRNGTRRLQEDLAATLWLPGGWQVPLDRTVSLRKPFREVDVRADRVTLHFRLDRGGSRRIVIPILARNAGSYRGAKIDFEALYDAALFDAWEGPRARVKTSAP